MCAGRRAAVPLSPQFIKANRLQEALEQEERHNFAHKGSNPKSGGYIGGIADKSITS